MRGLSSQFVFGRDTNFEYVIVENTATGIYLYWEPAGTIVDPAPYIYDVERSIDPDEDWEYVAQDITETLLYDTVPTLTDALPYYYRVTLKTTANTYTSAVISNIGRPPVRFQNAAKRILRRLQLPISDTEAYLLVRKIGGEPCPDCADAELGAATNSDCTTCFGTGRTGGYVQMPNTIRLIMKSPIGIYGPLFDVNQKLGTLNISTFKAKLLGFPIIKPYDAIVLKSDLRRYYITQAVVSAEIGSIPIIYDTEIRLAESNDVLQSFTLREE
ncbi:MAG TPA: hypothetical protein PKV43_01085 [Armatimonadota bacterium]|nr:hypothetical protein [Armatimonadota bacterium]